ncbi:MAG: FAD-dependent oxidoreductase [Gemmatimonadaceae bacterium]|nr:FAD-dependent oxidoreductase [Gemmatimonadaceae bacterium]
MACVDSSHASRRILPRPPVRRLSRRHLVLAGAGHAQLDLLAALSHGVPDGWDVTLVTPQPAFHYSGMLPAVIAGLEPASAAEIPVGAIARAAGISVAVDAVAALDARSRSLTLRGGRTIGYDILSLDVGSVPAGLDVPGVPAHAHPVRPFVQALALMARIDERIRETTHGAALAMTVVGGGAAGVEIAFAIRARVMRAGRLPRITIVDAGAGGGLPLPGFATAARERAALALSHRGISVRAARVLRVHPGSIEVDVDGREETLATCATAWVTGPAAHPWLGASGLPCDAGGYPLASRTLQLDGDGTAWGGGDCVTLRDAGRTARAGVYAVRMAPVLAANVLATMRGDTARVHFAPQPDFLALLSTGDGCALLRWHGVALESRWAQRLKTRIDTSYLQRYRALPT